MCIRDRTFYNVKMTNPWDSDPSFVNHGGLNHILTTNKKLCNDEPSHSYQVMHILYTYNLLLYI